MYVELNCKVANKPILILSYLSYLIFNRLVQVKLLHRPSYDSINIYKVLKKQGM